MSVIDERKIGSEMDYSISLPLINNKLAVLWDLFTVFSSHDLEPSEDSLNGVTIILSEIRDDIDKLQKGLYPDKKEGATP
jgi:hypothetical protein